MKVIKDIDIDCNFYLRDIENFLRTNIQFILKDKYGDSWEEHLGVTEDRIKKWNERKEEERNRLNGRVLESRLLFYSDFYDLKEIMLKNWELFKSIFKNKKDLEYQLAMLESFRNPNAHNRDLLEHQKYLLVGIVGEIKSSILEYRGSIEKEDTYFLSIDNVNINGKIYNSPYCAELENPLRKGDILDITFYVSAPPNQKVFYSVYNSGNWQEGAHFIIEIDEEDKVGDSSIMFDIKSDQEYHKINTSPQCDARFVIKYILLPEKQNEK